MILNGYRGPEPLAAFLAKFFSAEKKYGSKDRKQIAHLCYSFFRMGKAVPVQKRLTEEMILTGLFLNTNEPNEILNTFKPEWNERIGLPLAKKLSTVNIPLTSVFPWKEELSKGVDHEKLCISFFVQPDLFIRIRPGYAEKVLLNLDKTGIQYEFISPFSIRLPNSFKVDQYFETDKEIVVQDYNSQRIQEFLPISPGQSNELWDCCAGSGGKSILAYDINSKINLTVSDIRKSILANLKNRFKKAGIKNYRSFIIDLREDKPSNGNEDLKYEIILCDAPCTGSGTWGRTPEQLYFFNPKTIDQFNRLQKQIVSRVIPRLQTGGYFIYITCSVFKKENEEIAGFIKEKFNLQLKQMEVLRGYDKKADTMFVAVFC